MKYAVGFLLGTIFGAVIALLYAPSSGEELRGNMKTQMETQYARLQDEVQKGMHDMQSRMDQLSADLQTATSRSKKTAS